MQLAAAQKTDGVAREKTTAARGIALILVTSSLNAMLIIHVKLDAGT